MQKKLLLGVITLALGMGHLSFAEQDVEDNPETSSESEHHGHNRTWPRWGHDNRNTFANLEECTITKSNVSSLHQLWNFTVAPGDGYQVEPIVVDGLLYILSLKGFLYVVNTSNGTFYSPFNGGVPLFVGAKNNTNAGSTPVVDGDFIYTATDDLVVRSFNRFTGALNPNWPAAGVTVPVYPYTPEAAEQAVLQTSLTIVKDGKKKILFISTSSVDEVTAVAVQKGTQNAYDLRGNLLWSEVIANPDNTALGVGSWSTPSFDEENKLMFFGTSNPQQPPAGDLSDSLQARNYLTGELVWNYQYVANDVSSVLYPFGIGNPMYMVDKDVGQSPNVFDVRHNGELLQLVGANGKDGIYRAFDRCSGDLKWVTTLTLTPDIDSAPSAAYADGVIYAIYTSDILPSTQTPNPPLSPIYANAYPVQASTYADLIDALAHGNFAGLIRFFGGLLTANGIVTALEAATGRILWQVTFPTIIFASPVFANGILYVGSYDGTLRALDASTGVVLATYLTPLSTIPPGNPIPLPANQTIPTAVTVVDSKVFVPYENSINQAFGNAGVFALGL